MDNLFHFTGMSLQKMKAQEIEIQKHQCFLQGIFFGLFPVTLLVLQFTQPLLTGIWTTVAGITLMSLLGLGTALLFKLPVPGKILIGLGIALGIFLLYPTLCTNPSAALFAGVLVIASLYYLLSVRINPFSVTDELLHLERFRGSALSLIILTMLSPLFVHDHKLFSLVCLTGLLVMFSLLGSFLNVYREFMQHKTEAFFLVGLTVIAVMLTYAEMIALPAFLMAVCTFCYAMSRKQADLRYFSIIINHPGRSVFLTFALLCAAGTLLLRTPAAMTKEVEVIDAAFTSVSGVCVTGLSVIDIATELTLTGRIFLMILIQAGGLGIMTLASLVLHILGRRLSLNQEQLLTEMTSEQEQDVFQSLKQIVKVTFICEAAGALLLTPCFLYEHGVCAQAFELGIFTSVSAFCNAGFFPGAANLVPYSGNYIILIVTALLIITGGIAPAVTVSLLHVRKRGCRMPLVCKLVFGSTLILLASSTVLLLLFEWDGIFGDLSVTGKFINSFFLAASLRTAGFNTVAMEGSGVPAVIVMLLCMFIGGSPGGTAGGIKGTTLSMIVFTLRAAIRGDDEVIFDRHHIPQKSIIQAVAIISSATLVLLAVIVMLVTTQPTGAKEAIFECVSALGTVGLSLGATGELDAIGKIIIMATMFIGRIGPLTLFLLLSDRRNAQDPGYPPIRIPLG